MVKKIEDGGLAFPGKRIEQVGTVADHGFSDDDSPTFGDVDHPGMTLRDWFAGQALPAVIEGYCSKHFTDSSVEPPVLIAMKSYEVADAMIIARKAGA